MSKVLRSAAALLLFLLSAPGTADAEIVIDRNTECAAFDNFCAERVKQPISCPAAMRNAMTRLASDDFAVRIQGQNEIAGHLALEIADSGELYCFTQSEQFNGAVPYLIKSCDPSLAADPEVIQVIRNKKTEILEQAEMAYSMTIGMLGGAVRTFGQYGQGHCNEGPITPATPPMYTFCTMMANYLPICHVNRIYCSQINVMTGDVENPDDGGNNAAEDAQQHCESTICSFDSDNCLPCTLVSINDDEDDEDENSGAQDGGLEIVADDDLECQCPEGYSADRLSFCVKGEDDDEADDLPAESPSPTPTATGTFTPQPSGTPAPTVTYRPSPNPTRTGSPSPSPTPAYSPSPTATSEPAISPTGYPTSTPWDTCTASPTPEATVTWTPEPTDSWTPSPTPSDTYTASQTPEPTATWTPVPTDSWTPSPTPSDTYTASPGPTAQATVYPEYFTEPTASPSWTPTGTYTPCPGPEPVQTETWTPAPSGTWIP